MELLWQRGGARVNEWKYTGTMRGGIHLGVCEQVWNWNGVSEPVLSSRADSCRCKASDWLIISLSYKHTHSHSLSKKHESLCQFKPQHVDSRQNCTLFSLTHIQSQFSLSFQYNIIKNIFNIFPFTVHRHKGTEPIRIYMWGTAFNFKKSQQKDFLFFFFTFLSYDWDNNEAIQGHIFPLCGL